MKKEYDLEKMKERESTVDASAAKVPISIRIDGGVIAAVREEADRLGMPYQTLIQSVLHQFVSGELVSVRDLKRIKSILKRAS